VRHDALAKLVDEPRLADARVAREEDDLPGAGLRALEAVEPGPELALPADVGREPPRRGDVDSRGRAKRPDDLVNPDRLVLALDLACAEVARDELPLDEP